MYNRCSRIFDEGILPMCRKNHLCKLFIYLVFKSRLLFIGISLIIFLLLPEKAVAAAPKYETAYACEGKTLTIECEPGDLISLIRANYGRFSITICNDHGNVEWSVNCMSPKSLRVLHSRCAHKQNCSVLASTNMFGDPCPGTHKYLEAHYQCISAAQTSTTTTRPSPSWLLTSTQPTAVVASGNGGGGGSTVTLGRFPTTVASNIKNHHYHNKLPAPPSPPTSLGGGGEIHLAGGRPPIVGNETTTIVGAGGGKLGRPTTVTSSVVRSSIGGMHNLLNGSDGSNATNNPPRPSSVGGVTGAGQLNSTRDSSGTQSGGGGGGVAATSDDNSITNKNNPFDNSPDVTQSSVLVSSSNGNQPKGGGGDSSVHHHGTNVNSNGGGGNRNSLNNAGVGTGFDAGTGDNNLYCGPTSARNLYWNLTRVGEVNVQPCPGGATGIAKWRCVLMQHSLEDTTKSNEDDDTTDESGTRPNAQECINSNNNNKNNVNKNNCDKTRNLQPTWHPQTPDLTQCRSLWLNSLEVRVNQRDSSLISIATDLSQVTSSKTLYGGDMLVTTKIIQTMSEKMSYDIETFPDQRQREAIIYELLNGVVKTGSNLLDESQRLSWLDLSFEDQMRVATSLLTGLEDNAFLLADAIIRERNINQKVKNILLSVRVLETRNIVSNEIFPDGKMEWPISDDRIELPRGALIENSEGGLVRIVFVAFDRLESILKPSYDNLDLKYSRNYVQQNAIINDTYAMQQRVRILNSKVISASLGKGRHIQLSQPIKLILRHLKTENVSNPTCVFWNYIDHAWSADGCYLEKTNRTHSICMCNHLTNFAILMDVVDERNASLLSMFDSNLRILIYISVAICVIFIVIAILTLKLFNGVFVKSTRTSIYKNIYVCLFIIEILFLLGIEQSETSPLCGFTTLFLHCFILSAIAWLCFEGFQAYISLTTDDILLEVENSTKFIGYYLLSYGLSFTIVAISLAINPATYTRNDFCVLMESNALFYTTFFAPIAIFLMGAIVYTILACFIMYKKNNATIKNKEHTRLTNIRFDIRCSIIFLIILSADWIFAYFYLRRTKYAAEEDSINSYGYLFVLFNSALGIYIFIFHCIQNEKIRREYRKYVRQNSWLPKCLRCSKTSISSSTSHHHHPHYGRTGGGGPTTGDGSSSTGTNKKSPICIDATTTDNIITAAGLGGGNSSAVSTPVMSAAGVKMQQTITEAGSGCSSSGILSGTLQQIKSNSIMGSMQGISPGHIILERAAACAAGTLRTPSGGHVSSPTSSVGSTHLIFNAKQNEAQNWNYHQQQQLEYYGQTGQRGGDSKNLNTTIVDDKFLYYDAKSKRLKGTGGYPMSTTTPRNHNKSTNSQMQVAAGLIDPQQQFQQHEYFYWTEKNNHHQKKINGELKAMAHHHSNKSTDAMHTFYPSYKKTTMKQHPHPHQLQHHHYPVADEMTSGGVVDIDDGLMHERKFVHHHHRYNSKQLSSDEDHGDSSSTHLMMNAGPIGHGLAHSESYLPDVPTTQATYHHPKYNRYKKRDSEFLPPGVGSYYNHNQGPSSSSIDEPVYEEILNSRISSSDGCGGRCDDDGHDDDEDDDYEDEEEVERMRTATSRHRVGGGHVLDPDEDDDEDDDDDDEVSDRFPRGRGRRPLPPMYSVGRNISAMLDSHNTVRCYLEPLDK